jgi:hypothetical protein
MTALIKLFFFVKSGAFPDRAEAAAHPELRSRTIDQVDDYGADRRNKGNGSYDHQSKRDGSLVLLIEPAAQKKSECASDCGLRNAQ